MEKVNDSALLYFLYSNSDRREACPSHYCTFIIVFLNYYRETTAIKEWSIFFLGKVETCVDMISHVFVA